MNPTAPVASSYLSPYQAARLRNIEENNKALQELLVSTPRTSEEHSRGSTTKSTKTASSQKTDKGRESQSTPKSGTASNQNTSKGSTSGSTEKSGTVSKSSRSLRPPSSSKQPKYSKLIHS
ncbi:uncharacterized protein LOC127751411 [Frankliniella occidentalis]|uniref:Uncharacterized protein LOC127751411 n=1 Tax=Frankliniella occidentalis TaxID=133901 RepID=A0A9C6XTM7_FRAOC|nr:uncharacterized protein LOC127751411 [Frankliniella occidentalis]